MKKFYTLLLAFLTWGVSAQSNVTLSVDMSGYTGLFTTVHVNGDYNGWCGTCNPLTDMGSGIWEVTLPLTADSIDYKFTVDGWTDQENFSGGESCTKTKGGFTNRYLRILGDTAVGTVCFNSCTTCGTAPPPPPPASGGNVTFSVDMSNYTGSFTTVNVNGDFNGWCGTCNPLTDMGSGVWEVTLPLTADSIDYKFTVDGWTDQENFSGGESCTKTKGGFTNRYLRILGDTAVGTVCFNSCTTCGTAPPPPPPASGGNVTFSVDMSNYTGSFTTVNVNGDFNGWCGTCNPLTDMGSGVWEVTLPLTADSIDYKFTVDGWTDQENFSGGESCTKTKGGFTNRYLRILGDTAIGTVCFNSCSSTCTAPPPPGANDHTVTFRVNTANITVGPNGIYAGGGVLGGSNAVALTDIGGGIWEGTATVNGVNGGNFVFFNSPNGSADWGTKEDLTGLSCADPANYNDRIMPTFTQDTTLLFCFGSCETDGTCSTPPPPPVGGNVNFSVDMSNYTGSFTTVNVNGDFNGWCGTCNPLTDMGSGIWEVTLPLTADSIDYKFTVDGWTDQENFSGGEPCTKTKGGFTNRYLRILGDTAIGTVCFNSCSGCTAPPPPPVGGASPYCNVQTYHFMNPAEVASSIYISVGNNGAGSIFVEVQSADSDPVDDLIINSATGGYALGTMTNSAGVYRNTMTWSGTVDSVDINVLWSKASFGGNWQWSTSNVRVAVADTCVAGSPPPPPANDHTVTFRVNTANITVGPNGIYAGGGVLGGSNAVALSDIGGGIWEGTATVNGVNGGNFVFLNSPNGSADWGTKEDLTGLSCADPANYNDRIMPTFTQDTTLLFCFGSCETDGTCSTPPPPPVGGNVTFSVDMSNYTGSFTTVNVNGDFNGWCGTCNPLTDMGSGIWEVTLPLTADSIDYKFTVDGWTDQENFSGGEPCTKTKGGYTNRYLRILGDTAIGTVCFNSCSACTTAPPAASGDIQFNVDMNDYGAPFFAVYVSGSFNSWSGDANQLTDIDGDGVYTGTVTGITGGDIEYKFTVDNWADDESLIAGSSCTVTNNGFTNRSLYVDGDSILPTVCWESCLACGAVTAKNVTFTVDVADYTGSYTGIYVNGDFNGWCGSCNPLTDMGNDVWSVTIPLTADSIEYKFTADGWNDQENLTAGSACTKTTGNFTNRFAELLGDTALAEVCWNSCSDCVGIPTTANVTFRVDMSQYSGSFGTVNLNGNFNNWCGSCNPMSDADGDSIYETTLSVSTAGIEYKFTLDGWTTAESFTQGDPCTVTDTSGQYTNRYLLTIQDTTLEAVCWNSCSACTTAPPPPPAGGNVTFSVDMSNYTGSFTAVNVNGDFNGWCGTCNPLTDMGSGVWEVTLPLTADSIDYKFTVDGWNDQENFAGGESCTKTKGGFTNRYLRILGDTAVGTVCWNSCSVCTPPSTGGNVTLSVNMNAECAYDSVSVSGDFNSWGATAMTDMGGGIYSATVAMSAGSNDYKFSKYVSGSAVMESISNRNLNVTGDTTLSAVCFNNVANCSGGFGIDSVQTINVAQGVYRVHLNGPMPAATSYTVEWKPDTASVYRSKTFTKDNLPYMNINVTPWFNNTIVARVGVDDGTSVSYSCEVSFTTPCRPMTLQTAEQNAAKCPGDSALVRVGYAGGRGTKTILWSNGATTKRTYAQQGQTLTVTVTDATGCSLTESITASVLSNASTAPSNVSTTRSGTVVTVNWTASTFGAGQTLIGYRVQYRLRGTTTWSQTSLTTNTTADVDFAGGTPGNYEFTVIARYNDNGSGTTSARACFTVRGVPTTKRGATSGMDNGSAIAIYPNPAHNQVYVAAASGSEVTLMDLGGRILAMQTVDQAEVAFDLSGMANGVYMIQIQSNGEVITERVVKQ